MNLFSTPILRPRRNVRNFAPVLVALSLLLLLPACKHKQPAPSNENSPAVPTTPPANNPTAPSATSTAPQAPAQPEQTAPAPQPLIVSAGTTLTVRLADKLGSSASQTGQAFSATLDKDVIVDGQTAIAAGANLSGTVVSARPAGRFNGEAILVLRLTSINLNSVDQAIVTSTRSFGTNIKAKGKVRKFLGGLAKRAEGDEKEVVLSAQSACTFTLKQALEIQ
jgi:glucose/arabinose dehydrogenase